MQITITQNASHEQLYVEDRSDPTANIRIPTTRVDEFILLSEIGNQFPQTYSGEFAQDIWLLATRYDPDHPQGETPETLTDKAVSLARIWLGHNFPDYREEIRTASTEKISEFIEQAFPGGLEQFRGQVSDGPEYHENITPIISICDTHQTQMLRALCGSYLETLNLQERICLIHSCSYLIIREQLPDATTDKRILAVISSDVGKLLLSMKSYELLSVISCLSDNTVMV